MNKEIDPEHVVMVLIEILFERGLINKATFEAIKKRLGQN